MKNFGISAYNCRIVLIFWNSGRFLQPDKSSLWLYHGILLPAELPGNEGYRRVR